ncbi:MAG TPA: DUF6624 domain-containing protein [Thermoanaerobaculia bacterium]|nr:DUF6624 domain-containing protein [Thermoanaerobaculia bacterium]
MIARMLSAALAVLALVPARAEEPPSTFRALDPAVHCADVEEPALCAELLVLRDRDQLVRHRQIEAGKDEALSRQMEELDAANLARVVELLEERGWPGRSQVGERASAAAWVVIQHADLEVQERFLGLMESAAEEGELDAGLVALTVDRVRVRRGEPQLYGSQFREVDGEMVPYPIVEPERVDERRATVGLPPLAEYAEALRAVYARRPEPTEPVAEPAGEGDPKGDSEEPPTVDPPASH